VPFLGARVSNKSGIVEQQMNPANNPLARHGHLSYLEIPTLNPRASVTFYTSLFNWIFRDPDSPTPSFDDGTGQLIGRFHPSRTPSQTPGFLPYLYVTNIHDIVA